MLDGFHQGGWGMYPTAIAGLVLVAAAIQYARQPDRRRLGLVRSLSALTWLVATLGFVTGVIRSFTSAASMAPYDLVSGVVIGVGESLNNLGLGLVMLVLAAIATVVGRLRTGASPPASSAELTDPLAP